MEAFIERSNALLLARPGSTRVSARYTHKNAVDGGERADSTSKPAKFIIKTKDSKTGMVYKYKVRKAQELSRVLASLGPQNFEFDGHRKRGVASIMSAVEHIEATDTDIQHDVAASNTNDHQRKNETVEPVPSKTSSKSKKSKKSKKH